MLAWHLALAAHPWVAYKRGRVRLKPLSPLQNSPLCTLPHSHSTLHTIHTPQTSQPPNRLALVVMPSLQPTYHQGSNGDRAAASAGLHAGRGVAPRGSSAPAPPNPRFPIQPRFTPFPGASPRQMQPVNTRAADPRRANPAGLPLQSGQAGRRSDQSVGGRAATAPVQEDAATRERRRVEASHILTGLRPANIAFPPSMSFTSFGW